MPDPHLQALTGVTHFGPWDPSSPTTRLSNANAARHYFSELPTLVAELEAASRLHVFPPFAFFPSFASLNIYVCSFWFADRTGSYPPILLRIGEADATAHTPPVPKSGFLRRFIKTAASHVTNSEVGYLPPIELWAAKVEGGAAALEASCAARRAAIAVWVTEFSEESSHSV